MIEQIFANVQSVIVFIIVLSVLIVVHEWGHFITAKLLGIDVEEFSLGFGPKLWSKTHNGTEYMIKGIPLGGYVKMAGDEREHCTGAPGEFFSKPVGHRMLVVFNGPLVNFILGYFCFIIVFMGGYPGISTKLQHVNPGGPAAEAGLMEGDEITEVNGKRVYGWLNLDERIISSNGEPIEIAFVRGGETLTRTVDPEIIEKPNILGRYEEAADIGITAYGRRIGAVSPGYPAEQAGLMEGDFIMSIDGQPVGQWKEIQEAISSSTGETIAMTIQRDGQLIQKEITPKIIESKAKDGSTTKIRQVGIVPYQEMGKFYFGFTESLVNSWEKMVQITVLTFKSLYYMVAGRISAKESVTGPIGIFYIVKSASEMGFTHLLYIVGLISVSLAIFNLLPMFPLDGGHLLLYSIEKVRGKALPKNVDEMIARVGVTIIIALAIFVFYSDFARFGIVDKVVGVFEKIAAP